MTFLERRKIIEKEISKVSLCKSIKERMNDNKERCVWIDGTI